MPRRKDPAIAALDRLVEAADRTEKDLELLRERATFIRDQRAAGVPWAELVPQEEKPLIVQLLASVQERLNTAGAEWRRLEAQALYEEGMSMEAIAALFGVTRQRVSALLRTT